MQGRISPRSNLLRCRQFWLSSSSLAGSSIGNCREHKLGVSDRFDLDQKGACRPSSVWALSYLFVDTTPAGRDVLCFAFVNYTTLGYGDITPVDRWKLLGLFTAMNG